MIKLVLPYPVSANRYWRSFVPKGWTRAVVVPSPEAKSYRAEVGWLAKAAGCRTPSSKPIALSLRLYPRDRRLLDLDNALKVAVDALKGIAYVDDKQVWKITAERCDPDGTARLEMDISEYVPQIAEIFA